MGVHHSSEKSYPTQQSHVFPSNPKSPEQYNVRSLFRYVWNAITGGWAHYIYCIPSAKSDLLSITDEEYAR